MTWPSALVWILTCAASLATAAPAGGRDPAPVVTRCGWFDNPTPGNAWLTDRDAEWIVGVQGGHQADGDWPEFKPGEWVSTNRSYGYGCACMRVVARESSREVQRIVSASSRPLRVCRSDPMLAKRKPGT